MKRHVLVFLLICPLLVACVSVDDVLEQGGTCTVTSPSGTVSRFKTAMLIPGTNYITFFSDYVGKGSRAYELELTFSGDFKSGNFVVEQMSFLDLLSSSRFHSISFTGKVGFVTATDTQVILRLKNVRYLLGDGEYVLNGDLVAIVE
jgi:hypothetical protein